MKGEVEGGPPSRIQGQVLRFSEHRVAAIYLRDGLILVADFIDGRGTLADAATWFRFNCGTFATSHAIRRMAFESTIPLPVELVERIEALHHAAVERKLKSLDS